MNAVFRVPHSTRNEKNEKRSVYVPLVRFLTSSRKTKNDILKRFSYSARTKKNEIRQYDSYFVFRISHCIRNEKNEWRHCGFSSFALPEMRKTNIRLIDVDFIKLTDVELHTSISMTTGLH